MSTTSISIDKNHESKSWSQFGSNLVAGGLSGIIAKTIAAPIDRVKLLLQTQSINQTLTTRYTGPINCITRVFYEQGFASFWRGNLANVYRYFPNQAMNFAFKDRYKIFFFELLIPNGSEVQNVSEVLCLKGNLLCFDAMIFDRKRRELWQVIYLLEGLQVVPLSSYLIPLM